MSPLTALEILRAAVERADRETVATPEVRQALRALKRRCPDRDWLQMFWEAAANEHEIGRTQSLGASFNGIVRQLGLPMWVTDR